MPEDTHEDIRRRLFEAAWETPAFAPAPERTVARARHRAGTTIGGAVVAALITIVVAASTLPFEHRDRTAFVREGDDREFLVDVSSGRATEITGIRALERAWWLDVSPEGTQVAFTTDTTGSPQVYVANLDGSGLRQLTRGLPDVAQPVWSPEGERIAYIGMGTHGIRNLYVVDVATGRSRRVTDESNDTWSPEWSPDGRSILFNVTVKGREFENVEGAFLPNTPSYQLRVVELGSRNSRKVFGGRNTMGYDGTWTEAGIVFLRGRSLTTTRVERVDLVTLVEGSNRPERLVEIPLRGDEWAATPEASPDGATIAFVRVIEGIEQVLLFDVRTGRATVLRPGFRISWVDADTLLVQDRPA
jgi:Tol biopolymer transport system component